MKNNNKDLPDFSNIFVEFPDTITKNFPKEKVVYVSTEKLNRLREELGLPPDSPVYQRRFHVIDREKKDD